MAAVPSLVLEGATMPLAGLTINQAAKGRRHSLRTLGQFIFLKAVVRCIAQCLRRLQGASSSISRAP